MNCTKHFASRWAERIVKIEGLDEIRKWVGHNWDKIVADSNQTFESADLIYKGAIGDNITRHYYIKDDLVFVTDTSNTALITIYRVNFGFSKELNLTIVRTLMAELGTLQVKHEEAWLEVELEKEENDRKILEVEDEIQLLQKRLDVAKQQRKSLIQKGKEMDSGLMKVNIEIEERVRKLVNSKQYISDLANGLK